MRGARGQVGSSPSASHGRLLAASATIGGAEGLSARLVFERLVERLRLLHQSRLRRRQQPLQLAPRRRRRRRACLSARRLSERLRVRVAELRELSLGGLELAARLGELHARPLRALARATRALHQQRRLRLVRRRALLPPRQLTL